jgi:hypothetical protein
MIHNYTSKLLETKLSALMMALLLATGILRCGTPERVVAQARPTQPILDGRTVSETEYPYVGRLQYRGDLLCTGTLISSRYVLTAAHCFYDERNTRAVGDTEVTVRLNGREIRSKKIIINPTYRSRSQACTEGENDAALIELSSAVSDIQSIPILATAVPVGARLTLVGYGSEGSGATGENGSLPPDGYVNVGTTEVEGFGGDPASPTTASDYYFWRFDSGESNTGSGDSGGPAFYDIGAERYISGITCGGDDRAQFGTYSFNTRADVLLSWVRSVTGEVPPGTPPSFGTLGTHTATRGKVFSYDIPVSGSETVALTASGLPEGLALVGTSVVGTPKVNGTYVVGLVAQNEFGVDASTVTFVVVGYTPRVQVTRTSLAFNSYRLTDSLDIQGKIAVGSNFTPRNARVVVTIGRYTKTFRLNSSGESIGSGRSFLDLIGNLRRGAFTNSTVSFDMSLDRVALFEALSTLGFVANSEALNGQGVYLPVSISINGVEATATVMVRYSSRTRTWSLAR